jgi:hypothetical protein
MAKRIAVETLSLNEIKDLFKEALEIAFPKVNGAIANKLKELKKLKISSFKWVKTYEDFKGAKLNFYCEKVTKLPLPIISIGMIYRSSKGLILVVLDTNDGGNEIKKATNWTDWIRIYTAHYCERYAERIMKVEVPTFQTGVEGIMFSDSFGPGRITSKNSEGIEEIEFQFAEGQSYGYRDVKNKIIYYRTVYSNDMLKRDRLIYHEETKESIEQLEDFFKWSQ